MEVIDQYSNLKKAVHFNIPNIQGPFDLACLIWGSDIYIALYEEPELVNQLMDLVTETYIKYGLHHKKRLNLPLDSAYHCAGVKLVHGGVRVCIDSTILVSPDTYRELNRPRDIRAFTPFSGGWVHYCGDGNHFIDDLFEVEEMHYLHLGNPDSHDLLKLAKLTAEKKKVLVWSGSHDKIKEAREITGSSRILSLPENRYGATDIEEAKKRIEEVHNWRSIQKALW